MKRKGLLLLLPILLLLTQAHGQYIQRYVLASAGTSEASSSLSMDWTLGELMVTTEKTSALQMNQGFHQVYKMTVGTRMVPVPFQIRVYPIPVQNVLFLDADSDESLTYQVVSLTGQVLIQKRTTGRNTEIDLSTVPNAMYLIQVLTPEGLLLKTFKIIKTH